MVQLQWGYPATAFTGAVSKRLGMKLLQVIGIQDLRTLACPATVGIVDLGIYLVGVAVAILKRISTASTKQHAGACF